jgi:dolichol-phosphate mannosyltransferase
MRDEFYGKIKKYFASDHIKRFIKFGIVGASGFIVNTGFLWLFTEKVGLFYIISSVLAIALAMINNFIWNDLWTWRGIGEPGVRAIFIRLLKFILVASLAGYVGNLGVLWILTRYFHVYYMISNIFGMAVGTLINYFLNNYWTFKPGSNSTSKNNNE